MYLVDMPKKDGSKWTRFHVCLKFKVCLGQHKDSDNMSFINSSTLSLTQNILLKFHKLPSCLHNHLLVY